MVENVVNKDIPTDKNEGVASSNTYGELLPVCYLCNKVPEAGMCSGFFLKGIFICSNCEYELINSNVEDVDKYNIAIKKIRKLIFSNV
ncbi:MAG: sigma factor G inhibitor Gin [Clostridia bacterium]|nr:sigma factor G inhibitor Gin [Clostridia bacterium]